MMTHSFSEQTVMIAGAGGNLGSAVAKKFISSGANLVLIDNREGKFERIFPELIQSEQHLLAEGVDVNKKPLIESIAEDALKKYNRLDVLVNAVGGYQGGFPLYETPEDAWDLLFEVNVRTVYNLCSVIAPIMVESKSGNIINIAARAGLKGRANSAAYSAAKSSVIRLTEALAAELKHDGVTVNCILPGTIDTPQNRASMPNADYSRWPAPEDVANVILFLASNDAKVITGASIPVYGRS